jgi:hypothetical protein
MFLLSLVLFSGLLLARAEEKFGVQIYSGARYDAETTAIVTQMGGQAACYRTPENLEKVLDFYRKQPGATLVHMGAKGAYFKVNGVNVTVQSPWLNMKTGAQNTDTLISIVKN